MSAPVFEQTRDAPCPPQMEILKFSGEKPMSLNLAVTRVPLVQTNTAQSDPPFAGTYRLKCDNFT